MSDYRIERRNNARGTNLADEDQPVVLVDGRLMGQWTTLCGPSEYGFPVTADKATDEQLVWALDHDESVFA